MNPYENAYFRDPDYNTWDNLDDFQLREEDYIDCINSLKEYPYFNYLKDPIKFKTFKFLTDQFISINLMSDQSAFDIHLKTFIHAVLKYDYMDESEKYLFEEIFRWDKHKYILEVFCEFTNPDDDDIQGIEYDFINEKLDIHRSQIMDALYDFVDVLDSYPMTEYCFRFFVKDYIEVVEAGLAR